MSPKHSKRLAALAAIVFTAVLLTASNALAQHFTRTDLTANNPSVATVPNIDPNLVNAWGVARVLRFSVVGFRQRNRSLHSLRR